MLLKSEAVSRGIKAAQLLTSVTLILSSTIYCSAEYFSSVEQLQKLSDVEAGLTETFRQYLDIQEKELASYSRFIEHVKEQHKSAVDDVEDYLGNPINAFALIKRLVADWDNLHEYIKSSQAKTSLHEMIEALNEKHPIPGDEELRGAVKGIARLQKIYSLDAFDLSEGKINGVDYGVDLSWPDCFEIGTHLFNEKEFELASHWFDVTLQKLHDVDDDEKDRLKQKFELETLEYLALTNYELGKSDEALAYIEELLEIDPNHPVKDLQDYITYSGPKVVTKPDTHYSSNWFANYSSLCQGIREPEKTDKLLKCRVVRKSTPSIILAPLKIEELSLDPQINLYHGLLSEGQIEGIEQEAKKYELKRSTVQDGRVKDVRISQQVWLPHNSPITRSVYRLVEDATGLNLKSAESLQVANYGIGGQFDPHQDALNSPDTMTRIATNMFYLSDVEQGGYTVFPRINMFLQPVKGAMVSWYNLHRSLDPDYRTLHAGCPVLKGSKKIGNIWVRSDYQEFIRPCDLVSDTYKSRDIYKTYHL